VKKFTKDYYKTHNESSRFRIRSQYPYAIFSSKEDAEAFVNHLDEHFKMKPSIIKKSGSATSDSQAASIWDLVPPYGKAFAVLLLYRLYHKNISLVNFPDQPRHLRMSEFKDFLFHMAVRDGKWHDLIYTESEFKWYRDYSDLSEDDMQQSLADAKRAWELRRKKERNAAFGIGIVLLLISSLSYLNSHEFGAMTVFGFCLVPLFIGFGLWRLK